MNKEAYLKQLEEKQKELIKKVIDIFDTFDGDLTKIGIETKKSKQTISRVLNSELFEKMVKNGEISKEIELKIKRKLLENKKSGNKKGGETFKNNYDVIYNEEHRIIGHIKK